MTDIPEAKAHWTVDKRIPLALLVTIALQTGGIVWWAAGLSSRVASLEENRITTADFSARLVRLETNYEFVRQTLLTIDAKLDRIIERSAK